MNSVAVRLSGLFVVFLGSTGAELSLGEHAAEEVRASAPEPGAQAAGGRASGQREESAGRSAAPGGPREEAAAATGAGGAQGEANRERSPQGRSFTSVTHRSPRCHSVVFCLQKNI